MMIEDPKPVDAWFVTKKASTEFPIKRKKQIRKDGKSYVWLNAPLEFIVQFEDGARQRYRIKKGYKSDGGSIPKLAQFLIGPALGGAYEAATYAHDILCESRVMDAWDAGLVFRYLMRDIEVATWRMNMMYLAVRRICQFMQDDYPPKKVAFANEHLVVGYA